MNKLTSYQDLREVENTLREAIGNEQGSDSVEKTTKWVGDHAGVEPSALTEYAGKADIPTDPREAFLFGTQMGVAFRERAEGITA